MKLLVIVLSLLSERYLIHAFSQYRHCYLEQWMLWVKGKVPDQGSFFGLLMTMAAVFLPILFVLWALLALFGYIFYGVFYFLISLLVFYYCLGKENVFYPLKNADEAPEEENAALYLAKANSLLFAPIFWFVALGPYGVLIYRLADLFRQSENRAEAAYLADGMEWVSARVLGIFYLLAGNFQKGFRTYTRSFFMSPQENAVFLSECGLLAAQDGEVSTVSVDAARVLLEHALVVCLVFLAFFILAALT